MSDEVCAAAAAAHVAFAALVGMCSSALLFSPCIWFFLSLHTLRYAALVAHRLGAAMSDLQ